jgi:hypothetical protein
MDFVMGLPPSKTNKDSIWVVVDRLIKLAHFIPVNVRDSMEKLAHIYTQKIVSCTKYHQVLCLTKTRDLPRDFGTSSKSPWG